MKQTMRLTVICISILLLTGACRLQETRSAGVAEQPRNGNLDVTFLFSSDCHFGAKTTIPTAQGADLDLPTERINALFIEQMNAIAGKAYPAPIGGKVAQPMGLLVAGDLTDEGATGQWKAFVKLYGLTGTEGRLGIPVYETIGNHDVTSRQRTVSKGVSARHGGVRYSWDWGDLHVICLGPPTDDCLPWAAKDLAATGRDRPVIIYFHYSIVGPYSDDYWFGEGDNRNKFAAALTGYNVIGLFHGHFHASGWYQWQGLDVYNVSSPKHAGKDFFVVHVTDNMLTVCSWNCEGEPGWWWFRSKPINSSTDKRDGAVIQIYPRPGISTRPVIPHPLADTTTKKR
jgi:cytolysin (calcineurin-like family phosphatase)